MAEAVIGATIQVVLQTAISLAAEPIGLLLGFHKELEGLRKFAVMIQAFMADADAQQERNEAVKEWLKSLEVVAFDADHLLDEFNYEILRRKVKSRNQQVDGRQVCSFFFSFSYANIAFRSRMASKIRHIKNKFEKITQDANSFGLISRHQLENLLPATAGATTSRQTDSVVIPSVIGRDEDESKIVQMLLGPSEKAVSVIPITGMGGLGKTTLAKSIYNNPQIDKHFGKKIWVCVGKKIELVELLKFVLECSMKEKVKEDRRDLIVPKIQDEVKGKKYFLVLDDAWNDEPELWNDFFNTLGGLNATNGSWCLVTTRLDQVANAVSRHPEKNIHKLGKLSDDECWTILKQKVIGDEQVPTELEAIKKQILKRCDGLPLAACLIGGLLLRQSKDKWQTFVKESHFRIDKIDVNQIIKVSFDYLSPASVKKCFAYCSIFPQDTVLKKDLLIEHWMAEGFVQPDLSGERLMEDIGDEYFRILLQSSLLQEMRYWHGEIYGCKMHDLVHDFAKSVLNPESRNEYRYLALSSSEVTEENIIQSTSLRALCLESDISSDMLSKFKFLHVLKLSGADVNVLPTSIGKLIHLRLLDISYSEIKTFPESLCKLYNLQTLRMDYVELDSVQGGFPKQMGNLINLRHLHYNDRRAKFQMPLEIGRLTCLQTLKFFNVGKEKGRGIEELGTLKHLKGALEIRNLNLVKGKAGANQAKLIEKSNLGRLKFEWGSEDRDCSHCNDDDVLEGLQPHPNLKEFEIRKFMGENFPQWFMNLTTLVELELNDFRRCSEVPALGQLPCLKSMKLFGLDKIKCMGLSFYGINSNDKVVMSRNFFPALKSLELGNMENLVEWKGAEEVRSATGDARGILFPLLKELKIYICSQLTSAPCHLDFPSIESLDIYNCHTLLMEKISSNITTLSKLQLFGEGGARELYLETPRGSESHLTVRGCGNLPSEMIERLCGIPTLQSLEVTHCPNLTSLRRSGVFDTCLQNLKLLHCENLHLRDLHEFRALKTLEIGPFSDDSSINEFDWSVLKSYSSTLTSLELFGSPRIESLPDQLQRLTTLTRLIVCDFGIEALPDWLGNLGSLETLGLHNCKRLRYLPSVDAMTRLTKLRVLHASGSPLLKERRSKGELCGISQIPYCRFLP